MKNYKINKNSHKKQKKAIEFTKSKGDIKELKGKLTLTVNKIIKDKKIDAKILYRKKRGGD